MPSSLLLKNDSLRLRALEAEDLDDLYRWENDTRQWRDASNIAPFSRKQLWEYINTYDGDIYSARQLRLMIVDNDGQRVGMLDIYDFDPINRRAAVGVFIDENFRGQGFASKALMLLETYATDRLSLHQIYAHVRATNTASLELFKSLGYTTSGRLRSWLREGSTYADVIVLQKLFR